MSESALEFVETWVEEKIETMDAAPTDVAAQAKTLAAECIQAAQDDGITQSEINDAFDDLAAFIAAEIEEAFGRKSRPDEGAHLIEGDDSRVVDEQVDEEEDEKEEEKKA
jgi:hypothetical protein